MTSQGRKPVWDLFIRFFHWTMASAFLLNYLLVDESGKPHEWIGYYILAILTGRLLWGFVGPANARFKDFFPTPTNVKAEIKNHKEGVSIDPDRHNALGGLMIMSLLLAMTATGISGWMTTLDIFFGDQWLESSHEVLANIVMLLVIVHVSAVSLFSWQGPHNLIKIMILGYRKL